MAQALEEKVINRRFTFHDLRAYYTTQHKAQYGHCQSFILTPRRQPRCMTAPGFLCAKGLDSPFWWEDALLKPRRRVAEKTQKFPRMGL